MTIFHAENGMRPIHPGEHLREDFLIPLGMNAATLAAALHLPAPFVGDIVRERRAVTPEAALRLGKYFRTSPQYWLNWQNAYDLRLAQVKEADALAAIVPCPAIPA